MDELKPCPFCDKPPYVAEEMDPEDWWFLECRTINCVGPGVYGRTSIESAIEKWNRRAALAATQAPIYQERNANGSWTDISKEFYDAHAECCSLKDRVRIVYAAPVLETATQTPDPEETPVELWHGDRKVSIYKDIVLRVWGPNIETEMSDKPRTLQSVCDAVDWLYAAPESSVASKEE